MVITACNSCVTIAGETKANEALFGASCIEILNRVLLAKQSINTGHCHFDEWSEEKSWFSQALGKISPSGRNDT